MTNKQKIFSWGLAGAMLLSAIPVFASFSISDHAQPADYLISAVPNIGFYDYYNPSGTYVSEIHYYDACWGGGTTCIFTVSSPVTGTYGMVHNDGAVNTSVCTYAQAAAASGPCAGLTVYDTGTFTYPQSSGGGGSSGVSPFWDKPQNDFSASTTAAATSSLQIVQQRCIWIDASTSECVSTSTVPTGLTINDVNFLVMLGTFFSTVLFFGKVLGFS